MVMDLKKRTGGNNVNIELGEDNTTSGEIERAPQEENTFERSGELSRTGTAKRPGIMQITDPQPCQVCTVPITHSCISALGRTWHRECFTCKKCGKNLSSTVFLILKINLIAIDVYWLLTLKRMLKALQRNKN